jgi:hypothetical protein
MLRGLRDAACEAGRAGNAAGAPHASWARRVEPSPLPPHLAHAQTRSPQATRPPPKRAHPNLRQPGAQAAADYTSLVAEAAAAFRAAIPGATISVDVPWRGARPRAAGRRAAGRGRAARAPAAATVPVAAWGMGPLCLFFGSGRSVGALHSPPLCP